jgi:hypothetical protein
LNVLVISSDKKHDIDTSTYIRPLSFVCGSPGLSFDSPRDFCSFLSGSLFPAAFEDKTENKFEQSLRAPLYLECIPYYSTESPPIAPPFLRYYMGYMPVAIDDYNRFN